MDSWNILLLDKLVRAYFYLKMANKYDNTSTLASIKFKYTHPNVFKHDTRPTRQAQYFR